MKINIGQKFSKQLSKGKECDCEVVDIVIRTSTKTKKIIGTEYFAKSNTYAFGRTFEVSKNTIIRGCKQ